MDSEWPPASDAELRRLKITCKGLAAALFILIATLFPGFVTRQLRRETSLRWVIASAAWGFLVRQYGTRLLERSAPSEALR